MNEDYYFDDLDNDELDESAYFEPIATDEDDSSDEGGDLDEPEPIHSGGKKPNKTEYLEAGNLTKDEVWLINAYDDIVKCKPENLEQAVTIAVYANPKHTAQSTVNSIVKELFSKQGHSRRQNYLYDAGFLRGEDLDDDDVSARFNEEFAKAYQTHINNFFKYLANRDMSDESKVAVTQKKRHIAAFIIFLFSSGSYGYLMDCPDMPEEYRTQVEYAFRRIDNIKNQIITDLASEYDAQGRPDVANTVRNLGPTWFSKEPAEVKNAAQFKDLKLTSKDIETYRVYRNKWVNISTSITQETISDFIEVVINKKKGIYEKLKDKTRAQAVNEVKKIFETWSKEQGLEESELAKKLIFK